MNPHTRNLLKMFGDVSYSRHTWDVFRDFLELAAISFAVVDLAQREKREARYLQVIKGYEPDEAAKFPRILGELVLAMELEPADVLGQVYMELGLGSKWHGQFFTPDCICDLMAAMVFDKKQTRAAIADRGFITLQEPAVGGGAMVIGFCKAMKAAGFNYQRQLHVTAVDVDEKAVHMAYLQLSLLHVPAVIVVGNTLTLEQRAVWYTPAHIFGGWNFKLRTRPLQMAAPATREKVAA